MERHGGLLLPREPCAQRLLDACDALDGLQLDVVVVGRAVLLAPSCWIDTVVMALSLSWLELLGNMSFSALGLMSVVAINRKSSSRNIRSVIDDAEKDLSTLEPCLIAITH